MAPPSKRRTDPISHVPSASYGSGRSVSAEETALNCASNVSKAAQRAVGSVQNGVSELPIDIRECLGEGPTSKWAACPERVVIVRPAALDGIELWNVQDSKRKWTIHHEAYTFCAVDRWLEPDRNQSWWYRRRTHSMTKTSMMLLEPGELHRTLRVPRSDFRVLIVEPEFVHELLGEPDERHLFHFREGQHTDPCLVASFQSLCARIEHRSHDAQPVARRRSERETCSTDPAELEEQLVRFLHDVMQAAGERRVVHRAVCQKSVRLARDYIHENFTRKISLSDLARLAALSPYHFARSFRAEMGLSPYRYLRQVRIGWALTLQRTGLPPAWVSHAAGFYNQAEMTRAFLKELGFTPGHHHGTAR
jgi:AraC-like DNA-binding protein